MNMYAAAITSSKMNYVKYLTASSKQEAYGKLHEEFKKASQIIVIEIDNHQLCQVVISQKFTPEETKVEDIRVSDEDLKLISELANGTNYFVKSARFKNAANSMVTNYNKCLQRSHKNYDLCTKLILEKEELAKQVTSLKEAEKKLTELNNSFKESQQESTQLYSEIASLKETNVELEKVNKELNQCISNYEKTLDKVDDELVKKQQEEKELKKSIDEVLQENKMLKEKLQTSVNYRSENEDLKLRLADIQQQLRTFAEGLD